MTGRNLARSVRGGAACPGSGAAAAAPGKATPTPTLASKVPVVARKPRRETGPVAFAMPDIRPWFKAWNKWTSRTEIRPSCDQSTGASTGFRCSRLIRRSSISAVRQ
ncbi:hypothetical protein GCM10010452_12350 [Crossiella cryophila]